jgi:hypothetical protein
LADKIDREQKRPTQILPAVLTGSPQIIHRFLHNPGDMKIKSDQLDRLADQLLKNYHSKELMVLKTKESEIRAKIKSIVEQNFHEEEVIEEEARKMLASHATDVREMDHYKMFLLIKHKLAEKRGFIL